MKSSALHRWPENAAEAREIQIELRNKVERRDRFSKIRVVAGADVAFIQPERRSWEQGTGRAIAALVLYSFPAMEELETITAVTKLTFPYVPGLLSFRELPILLKAFEGLHHEPDLIFCDAHGYAHPRRFGLACHLGVLLDIPTIGCAKSILVGSCREPDSKAGRWTPLRDARANRLPDGDAHRSTEIIGAAVRTTDHVRPIYVSPGHRVSLRTAIRMTLAVCDGRRIPLPTRAADRLAGLTKQAKLAGH
jgi:deoxyribonuclease V